MSVMEKLFGAFKPQTNVIVPPHMQQAPQNPNVAPTNNLQNPPNVQQVPGNPTVPADGSANPPPEASPLNKFAKVWEPTPAEQTPPNQQTPPAVPEFQKIMQAAQQVDFSKLVTADELQKIQAGGPEAAQVLVSVINKTAQETFGRSMAATAKIVEQQAQTMEQRFTERLPSAVNKISAREQLIGDNPAFNDPAVAPLVEMVQSQLQQKFPNANAQELAALSKEYFQTASAAFNPTAKPTATAVPKAEDWSMYGPTA